MDAVETLQQAIGRDPGDDTAWLALADSLVEAGADDRAELVRLQLALRRQLDDPAWSAWQTRLMALWASRVKPAQPTLEGPFELTFVLIPPGSFWMGALPDERWMDDDEHPRHRVTLTNGFYLASCPITREQWQTVTGLDRGSGRGERRPIERVARADCEDFCERLSERLDRRVRLPTEAEWEYACRAGTSTLFCSGSDVDALRQVGWCSYTGDWDSSGGSRSVGERRPNSWGLYDMHGNVWEWCADWFDARYYERSPAVDPPGPAEGTACVVRGGSWRGGPWFCRSAERRDLPPGTREINLGFRVAVDLD
ncbi:MAG: SUMF1/EgtB/PvdO family nonheme iron enzyme [Gemmataceae bacterium]